MLNTEKIERLNRQLNFFNSVHVKNGGFWYDIPESYSEGVVYQVSCYKKTNDQISFVEKTLDNLPKIVIWEGNLYSDYGRNDGRFQRTISISSWGEDKIETITI